MDGTDLVAGEAAGGDPEDEALLADSVGPALLVVLETLAPAERLAFVLHDLFGLPFDEIAPIVERSPAAARQLASRARRRVRGATVPDADLVRQREVVEAFLAASRTGDFDGLVAVLDPGVVLRADRPAVLAGARAELRGAAAVAGGALTFSRRSRYAQLALVDGAPGIVVARRGRLLVALRFAVADRRIKEIDVTTDPARLGQLNLAILEP